MRLRALVTVLVVALALAVLPSGGPSTYAWTDLSTLTTLDNLQGVITLGGVGASPPWAIDSSFQQGPMHNCPQPGRWAISVWSGQDGTNASQALATCGTGSVAAAYSLDPQTGSWSRWFADRPDMSTLETLDNMRGVIALGAVSTLPSTGRIAFASDRDGDYEIYVVNADGTGQTRLTNNPTSDLEPAWSPDGTKIAFISHRDGDREIYVMNIDGTGQTNLTNDPAAYSEVTWSPDGSQIAFVSYRGDSEIYVMNADGSGLTNLSNDSASDYDLAWSPDGTKIAFVSNRDGDREIYVMNADGTGQTNLTSNPASDLEPAWSPDGTKIAFTSNRDDNVEIYVMNGDGSGQTNLTNNPARDSGPEWSPDGTKIAFMSDRDMDQWASGDVVGLAPEIYVMNADGTGQTNLTNNPAPDDEPAWSPDGSKIAFKSYRDGDHEIYVMDADGTGQTNLTNDSASDVDHAWLPAPTPSAEVTSLTCVGPPGTIGPMGPNEIRATLQDADGSPLAGYEILWSDEPGLFGFDFTSSLTDGSGTAAAHYMVPWDLGVQGDVIITATFPGDATYAPSSCQVQVHAESPAMPTPAASAARIVFVSDHATRRSA